MSNKLVLVGVDGGSWKTLHRLIDAGRLPALARLVEGGISGQLDPGPNAGLPLWAGLATGVPLAIHGVASALEPRPDGGGVQPAGARSWRAAPLWDILAAQDIPAIAVGWPGTSCATDWQATVVDDRYAQASATLDVDWPMAPRCVHPVHLRESLRDLRVHPEDLDEKALRAAPAPVLAHAASMHAAATCLMEAVPWRFLAVHYGPLLAAGGLGAALLLDAMLARLQVLAGADGDSDIVVAGSDGLLAAAGPGFAADLLVHGARPADVTATVLARFGIRCDNAAGRVLDGTHHPALRTIVSPAMPGNGTSSSTPEQLAPAALLETARHAMADGDFGAAAALLEPALQARPDDPELVLLLGQCRFFLGDRETALALGRRLSAAWPDRPWGPMMVGAALMQGGDADAARPFLDDAVRLAGGDPQASLRLGAIALHLGRALEAETHYARALDDPACAADAQAGLGLARLAQGDMAGGEARLRTSLGLRYHAPALHHQLGVLYASQGRWNVAAEALRTALAQRPGVPEVEALLDRVTGASRD